MFHHNLLINSQQVIYLTGCTSEVMTVTGSDSEVESKLSI